VALLSKHLV